jgi:hypothetical protein
VECSTVSKAFSKSSLRMITSLFDGWHWWIYSWLQARQSCIVLEQMKPYWFWWTNLSITVWSRSAKIWSRHRSRVHHRPHLFQSGKSQYTRGSGDQSGWPFLE